MRLELPIILVTVTGLTGVALAGDDAGIYPPGVAPDAAFVRVVDLSGVGGKQAQVDTLAVPIGDSGTTPYQVVTPGAHQVELGVQSTALQAEPHMAYTIALDATGKLAAVTITDLVADDPAKATVALYNFSGQPIDLTALAGDVPVFSGVEPGTSQERQMNPVTVELKVKSAGQILQDFSQFAVAPRSLNSFFVFDLAGVPVVKTDVARGDH